MQQTNICKQLKATHLLESCLRYHIHKDFLLCWLAEDHYHQLFLPEHVLERAALPAAPEFWTHKWVQSSWPIYLQLHWTIQLIYKKNMPGIITNFTTLFFQVVFSSFSQALRSCQVLLFQHTQNMNVCVYSYIIACFVFMNQTFILYLVIIPNRNRDYWRSKGCNYFDSLISTTLCWLQYLHE